MIVKKAILSFKKNGDDALLAKGKEVQTNMNGNANFPVPDPTMPQLDDAVANYEEAFIAAQNLGRVNVAQKNQTREILIDVMTKLVVYVNFIAKGNEAVLLSSGFDITKDREPRRIGTPGPVTLANGMSPGEIVASIDRVVNATGYQFSIANVWNNEDTVWTGFPAGKSKYVFSNLLRGRQYWVRVAVVGTANQIVYSEAASIYVQ